MTRKPLWIVIVTLCAALASVSVRLAYAAQLGGTITITRVLTEDSELMSDVTCAVTGAPCIAFGASGISLKLNGFSITGQGDAATGCAGAAVGAEVGIDVNGQQGVIVQGPGVIQRFRGHGVRLLNSTRVLVLLVTASTNCLSGLFVTGGSDNNLESNISVRNGNETNPCGGICLAGATRGNRVRANWLSGNGYAAQGNNFGIGLVTPGTNLNIVTDNVAVGNTNGIILVPGVEGNIIMSNLAVGNPPIQVSVNSPGTAGVDIRNQAAPGSNTVQGNVCVTSVNAICSSAEASRRRP